MISAGSVSVEVSARDARFRQKMSEAERAVKRFSDKANRATSGVASGFAKAGRSVGRFATSLTGLTAIFATGLAVRSATSQFASFEATMNNVRAVSGATGTEFHNLNEKAQVLGSTTRFSATQVAESMSFMAMAGLNTRQIYDGVEHTLGLAAAANLDLGQSADIVTNVMTSLGLQTKELGRATDVLTKTFTSSNTNLSDLGFAFKYVAPVAKAAGLEFEEVSAALGMLGNAGMQGTMAGTSLRGAIIRLLDPSNEAKKALAKYNITVKDATGKMKPFVEILKQFAPHAKNVQLFAEVFGQRAGPGMVNLVGQGSEALARFTRELRNAEGTTKRIAEIQMQGLRGAFIEAKSAAEGLAIALGESGLGKALESLVDGVAGATRKLTGFVQTLRAVQEQSLSTLTRQRQEGAQQIKEINAQIAKFESGISSGKYNAVERFFARSGISRLKEERKKIESTIDRLSEYERLSLQLRKPVATVPKVSPGFVAESLPMSSGGDEGGVASKRAAAIQALQRLESDYLTKTQQNRRLIELESERELAKFKKLLDDKLISQEQFETARQQLAAVTAKKMESIRETEMKMFNDIASTLSSSMEGALREFVQNGKVDFKELTRSILADIAVIALRMAVLQPLLGKAAGGTGTGLLGSLIASSVMHSGGIVGSGGVKRDVPSSLFLGAPRLHNGGKILKQGEVPAILQRGETVTPAGKSSGVTVQIINNAKGVEVRQEQERSDNGQLIKRFVVEQVNRNMAQGAFDGSMRARFGAKAVGTRR